MTHKIKVGQTFTRSRSTYVRGYRERLMVQAEVLEILTGYTYPWTGEQHDFGIRFRVLDELDGTSIHTLPLDLFQSSWKS